MYERPVFLGEMSSLRPSDIGADGARRVVTPPLLVRGVVWESDWICSHIRDVGPEEKLRTEHRVKFRKWKNPEQLL